MAMSLSYTALSHLHGGDVRAVVHGIVLYGDVAVVHETLSYLHDGDVAVVHGNFVVLLMDEEGRDCAHLAVSVRVIAAVMLADYDAQVWGVSARGERTGYQEEEEEEERK